MIKETAVCVLSVIPMIVVGCAGTTSVKPTPLRYEVHRLAERMSIDGEWDKPQWRNIEPLNIGNYMGEEPEFRPSTQAKLLYDDRHIYVIFRVEDQYVRAVAQEVHGRVWEDSCVEFFFTPGRDPSQGYFNLEVNCGGTPLFHYQKIPRQDSRKVAIEDMQKIEIAHSLPSVVEPEITEPVTWVIEYRLPLEILEAYGQVTRPQPGTIWRANFYKCADKSSHPHWLTWSVVDHPVPDFHLPQFFGVLEFGGAK